MGVRGYSEGQAKGLPVLGQQGLGAPLLPAVDRMNACMHAGINESRDSRPSLTVMSLPQAQGDVTPLGFSLSMTASPLAPSGGSIGFHLG